MRVLMVSWEYPPHVVGGMGKHVLDLAPALARQAVDLHIVTPLLGGGSTYEQIDTGVHVHRVAPAHMDPYDFVAFVQQTNLLLARTAQDLWQRGIHFDLIHTHDWLGAHAGVSLKYSWEIPLIATVHATERGRGQGVIGSDYAERVNGIEWWLTYEAWRVITCSRFMANQVQEYFGTPADKIDVV